MTNPARLLTFLLTLAIVLSALPGRSVQQVHAVSGKAITGPATIPVLSPVTSVDLSTYVRTGRFDLPEPTRTAHPPNSLLAQEASAVTYNWDTDTLFVVGDGGTSVVQVTKAGALIDSMTLAPGPSPQGTDFYDTEGITYVGGNKFVLVEERDRQANLFTYSAGGILHKTDAQTVKLGTTIGNIGLEGVSYDPLTSTANPGFIFVKEKDPQSIFQTNIDFAAGTATNGSPSATGSTNLFDPALANLVDFSDVFALSNLPSLSGQPDFSHLLILSQESGQIVNVDRAGNISSTLTIVSDPGNPLSVAGQTHEGVTMDRDGNLYVVSENGGGDANHPQLWVYAHSDAPNHAPTAVILNNAVSSIPDNTLTNAALKLADITVTDDGLGNNHLTVTGTDAGFFQIIGTALFLKAGTILNHITKPSYSVTVNVDDAAVGATPDATTNYNLTLTAPPSGGTATLVITEIAAWSSGSPVQADWFELTNTGTATANIAGWTMDDDSDNSNSALLSGITNINPNESVVFLEIQPGANAVTVKNAFVNTWFAGVTPPGLQIGTYAQGAAGGVGLGTGGDHVNLFNGVAGTLQAKVTFGTSDNTNPLQTFDNAALLNNTSIATLSQVGVHGAFVAANDANEIGSPGTIGTPTTPVVSITATDNAAAEEPAGNTGKFRVSRSGSTISVLTVSYTISGSANNADYTPELTGVATIPSGQSFVDITITPVEDTLIEGPETLILTLGDSGSYDVGSPASATVNIADNVLGVPPFLGVAAGDADTTSAVLWTRVDQQAAVPVHAQVATASDFSGAVMSFAGMSDPARDYTVKLVAGGLNPGTRYYYRFVNDNTSETSGTGAFKTVPLANTGATPLHFGFSGDNDGLMRPYALGSVLPSQHLDFYLNLGDLIYETASNANGNIGTSYLNSPSVTLSNDSLSFNGVPRAFIPGSAPFATDTQLKADYEKKYRENFLPVNSNGQNSLQVMYAGQGNYTTWDNHELGNRKYIDGGAPAGGSVGGPTGADMPTGRGVDARNNGAGNPANKNDAADLLSPVDLANLGGFMNKAVGFQTLENVLFEYQPLADRGNVIAPGDSRTNGTRQLYSAVNWGRNALFVNTDSRSYRDIRLKTADASADDTGPRADNSHRTFLGVTQLAWLKQTLLAAQNNGTTWKFVSLSDPIDQLGPIGGSLSGVTAAAMQPFSANINYAPVNSDGGKSLQGGYRAERNDLLKFIADNHITNVVFLSTDDHQNRVNELYYSPSGDTGNQSSYAKVPYTFAIVCGPLGATGPDLFLNHTFAGAQSAANLIANAQILAGIDPIGLQNYPGLHDLFRDGDPTAGTNPQPADFYSPDTFNFTVLDVSPSGKTLTVKSVGMNSTAQNAATEYANGPQARTIFSFQIDGFESLQTSTQAIRNELEAALESATNNKDIDRLTDAIRKLDDASNPDVWLSDGNHLACNRGDSIFNRYKDAVQKLMEMIQDTSTPAIPDATIQNWINTLVSITRDLAETADLSAGDADAARGSFDTAIEDYRKAWNGVTGCNPNSRPVKNPVKAN